MAVIKYGTKFQTFISIRRLGVYLGGGNAHTHTHRQAHQIPQTFGWGIWSTIWHKSTILVLRPYIIFHPSSSLGFEITVFSNTLRQTRRYTLGSQIWSKILYTPIICYKGQITNFSHLTRCDSELSCSEIAYTHADRQSNRLPIDGFHPKFL